MADTPDKPKTPQGKLLCEPTTTHLTINAWDQQPGERDKHFAIFLLFKDLPLLKRSVSEAYRVHMSKHGRKFDTKGQGTYLHRIANKHKWHARAEAYDKHLAIIVSNKVEADNLPLMTEFQKAAGRFIRKANKVLDCETKEDVQKCVDTLGVLRVSDKLLSHVWRGYASMFRGQQEEAGTRTLKITFND